MVWVAAVTGLRWGEVACLTVGQLQLVGRATITVDCQVGRDEHGRPIMEEPKTEAGNRSLSIPDELRDLLSAHLVRTGLSFEDKEALLFPSPGGGLLRYEHWRRHVWAPAAVAAGFSREVPDSRHPGQTRTQLALGFHDLRRPTPPRWSGSGST